VTSSTLQAVPCAIICPVHAAGERSRTHPFIWFKLGLPYLDGFTPGQQPQLHADALAALTSGPVLALALAASVEAAPTLPTGKNE
jgi:hypothetical protein